MRLKSSFYWKGMKTAVIKAVQLCEVCQRNKHQQGPLPGLLQPLPVPQEAWSHISLDFIEGLPKSQGKTVILVVIDRFTKYAHFLALSHPYSAESVAQLFLDSIYKLHGAPISMVSDRDKVFTSVFWKTLFKLMGTTLLFTSAYHPQTDGQTERLNQCLEHYLRSMVSDAPRVWCKWLSLAEYWYNTSYHTSLKLTPFQALYGYPPSQLSLDSYIGSSPDDGTRFFGERQDFLKKIRDNLLHSQERMKYFADRKRVEKEFQVGDLVFVKLQPYRQTTVAIRKNLKLSAKFFGPYKILERLGKVAYRLDLPDSSKIHPVFHVSKLKKFLGEGVLPEPALPEVTEEGLFKISPFCILDRRVINRRDAPVLQWRVQWSEFSPDLITWEDASFVRKRFHLSDPCGQGSPPRGGNVMNKAGEEGGLAETMTEKLGFSAEIGNLAVKEEGTAFIREKVEEDRGRTRGSDREEGDCVVASLEGKRSELRMK